MANISLAQPEEQDLEDLIFDDLINLTDMLEATSVFLVLSL